MSSCFFATNLVETDAEFVLASVINVVTLKMVLSAGAAWVDMYSNSSNQLWSPCKKFSTLFQSASFFVESSMDFAFFAIASSSPAISELSAEWLIQFHAYAPPSARTAAAPAKAYLTTGFFFSSRLRGFEKSMRRSETWGASNAPIADANLPVLSPATSRTVLDASNKSSGSRLSTFVSSAKLSVSHKSACCGPLPQIRTCWMFRFERCEAAAISVRRISPSRAKLFDSASAGLENRTFRMKTTLPWSMTAISASSPYSSIKRTAEFAS